MEKGTFFCIAKGGDGNSWKRQACFECLAFRSLNKALNGTKVVLLVGGVQVSSQGISYVLADLLDETPDDKVSLSQGNSNPVDPSVVFFPYFKGCFFRLWRYRQIPSVRFGIYLRLQDTCARVHLASGIGWGASLHTSQDPHLTFHWGWCETAPRKPQRSQRREIRGVKKVV